MVSTQNDKGTFIFKFALCIYLVTMMLDVSMFGYMDLFSKVSKGMRYFAYLLLIWKIIGESSYTPRQLINYAICILISIISYRASGSKLFIFLMLCLIAVSNIYFQEILKVSLWTNGICLAAVILFCKIGLIPDRFASSLRNRHAIGFNFTTIGSNYWLYFVLLFVCYRKKKITWIECVILELVSYYFFTKTNTRNAFAATTLVILLAFILKVWKEDKGRYIFSFLIKNITWIGTALFGLLMFLYDKIDFVAESIDKILSDRIFLSCRALENYGIRLFGQYIEWVGGTNGYDTEWREYNYVDSSYIQSLLSYGIVILLIIFIAYYFLGREIIIAKDWYFGLAIVLGAIHSIFDPQFLWMQYNMLILALGYLLVPDKTKRRKYLFGISEQGGI